MFSNTLFAAVSVALAVSLQVSAHAAVAPVLGVKGNPTRNDVQRPSTAAPCGKTNIAATIDTSTAVAVAADGTFSVTATNFNAGKDGSRQVSFTVDATGTGKSFVAGTVVKNGDLAPTSVGSLPITAKLPAGTKCTGGKNKNLCLASFVTASGFGNCVVISQGAAAAAAPAQAAPAQAAPAKAAAPPAAVPVQVNKPAQAAPAKAAAPPAAVPVQVNRPAAQQAKKGRKGRKQAKAAAPPAAVPVQVNQPAAKAAAAAPPAAVPVQINRPAAGTRAARSLLSEIEVRGEAALENARRGVVNWIWA